MTTMNTVTEDKYGTFTKKAPFKWDHFDRGKLMLKILLVFCIESLYFEKIKIIPKRYFGSLWVSWLQSYKLSKLEVLKDFYHSASSLTCLPRAEGQNFFQASNFDTLQLCSQLTYRDPKDLFEKI